MAQETPLINGIRHAWASIRCNILGRTVTGITKIAYDDKQNKENKYGAGIHVDHRGMGNYEATASLTLFAYETEAITDKLPGGKRLQDIAPFDIVVSFVNESNKTVTHTIRNCEFTNNKRDMSQGDTGIEVEHELIITHIEW